MSGPSQDKPAQLLGFSAFFLTVKRFTQEGHKIRLRQTTVLYDNSARSSTLRAFELSTTLATLSTAPQKACVATSTEAECDAELIPASVEASTQLHTLKGPIP